MKSLRGLIVGNLIAALLCVVFVAAMTLNRSELLKSAPNSTDDQEAFRLMLTNAKSIEELRERVIKIQQLQESAFLFDQRALNEYDKLLNGIVLIAAMAFLANGVLIWSFTRRM
jgi:hypothetical protein